MLCYNTCMKIVNRKLQRDYEILETLEVGVMLTGPEVKSIREEKINLDNSHVKILGNELFLVNADIYPYLLAPKTVQETKRSRKLLIHKKELLRLQTKMHGVSGLTIAPVSCYNKGALIKVAIALVRGRKDIEKRKLEKQRDMARNEKREVKEYLKH